MRLFVGLRPSEEFRTALAVLQDRLRAAGVSGRFPDPSGLHLTLAYIGEWPEDITSVLPPVTRRFSLVLSRLGLFPEAKVLWAGVEPSPALDRLAERTRCNLACRNIPFDPKPFTPHFTLVRKPLFPSGMDLSEIGIPSAVMPVEEVCLYRSDHGENGMIYTVIGSTRGKQRRKLT